jgi:hypothetical protein
MFLNLITSKGFWVAAAIVVLIAIKEIAYHKGYIDAAADYKAQLDSAMMANLENLVQQERAYKERENELIRDYQQQAEILKKSYEKELIVANNIRDTYVPECLSNSNTGSSKVSRETKVKSSARCYTETDLLSKIKESLDIGKECDELALKYNTLLEMCKEQL